MKTDRSLGICLGASSLSFVVAEKGNDGRINIIDKFRVSHNGEPKRVLSDKLPEFYRSGMSVCVTGRKLKHIVNLPNISEPEATEYALDMIDGKYDAAASLGGETFLVYTLDSERKISNIITKNQCASGTGEFFLQQIRRMGLDVISAIDTAVGAEPFKVSGRCSVFCKSDCTHALNKGTPKNEVTAGLALMIADKVEELIRKVKGEKFLLLGGVTKNKVVMDFIREKIPGAVVPENADVFEAMGAAVYALKNPDAKEINIDDLYKGKSGSFVFHPPLKNSISKVSFKSLERAEAKNGDRCILGLDVGSTTTKAVIIRERDSSLLASVYLYTKGNPIQASRDCYRELDKQIDADIKIIGLGVTGSGRHIAGLHALTDGVINEIIAHASAAIFFDPEVDTIFEIGGQDAKYTHIVNKVPADYAMNEACSAGTGSFLEEAAYESLGVKLTEIEQYAMKAENPPNFSDQCAAFISSDIKTAQQENISKDDIIAGLVYSVCLNYVNRVKGPRPVGKKVFMQGGVCYNKAVPMAMAELSGNEIIVPPEPGLMGAFGVALEVKEKISLGIMREKDYDLKELAGRAVKYHKPFTCAGGREKCDIGCSISLIEVRGKKYPFGGACDKYYNVVRKKNIRTDEFDYVKVRQNLMFGKYAPEADLPENAPTMGMNLSFHTHTLYPLYYNFFTKLGFRVVLPDKADEDGMEREMTSFCYPGQVAHGMFRNLLDKKTDYIFVPNHLEMNVDEGTYQRMDFNCSCIFVSGEPYYLKQAFKDYNLNGRYIDPIFNFGNGISGQKEIFIQTAARFGIKDRRKASDAFDYAHEMQIKFRDELFAIGSKLLKKIENDPDAYAIVLVGRPYNTFTEDTNKGIPGKIASRGVYAIPYDMFDYRFETIDDDMYWEGGKKILKVAKIIKRHPKLFATYVSNFSCAPDSMIIPMFRRIMGAKPSLTLELDSHSADAGINTRLDAAIDIINNYRRISEKVADPDFSDFTPARVEFGEDEGFFISSEGEKLSLSDPSVDILLPSMGDLASELFAAGMRSQGFNAKAVKMPDSEILKYGRAVATGKECLPLILMTGSLLDYLENQWDGKQKICFFIVQGAGNCRLGYYPSFMKNVIKQKRIKNVTTLELMHEDGFAGLGPKFASRGIETLIASDVLEDTRNAILANAVDPVAGEEAFYHEFNSLCKLLESKPDNFYKGLKKFSANISKSIPVKRPIEDSRYVALVGEMYCRRDGFSHKWLNRKLAEKGFIVKDAYLTEWIFYVDYLLKEGLYEPLKSLKNKYERLVRISYMRVSEQRIKSMLAKTGFYEFERTKVEKLVNHGKHIVPLEFKGEPLLVLGATMKETGEKYCGVINVGPFGCMQSRFAEAVTVPEANMNSKLQIRQMNDKGYKLPKGFKPDMEIPFLSIEVDGNAMPQIIEARLETFMLRAARFAEIMGKKV